MAVFTLEADYSGETGYPFDNFESEQYARLSPSSLTYNLIEDGLSISGSLCTPVPSPQKEEGR